MSKKSTNLTRRNFLLAGGTIAGSCALGLSNISLAAQSGSRWQPTRTVHIIVPFAPGGGSDVFARNMAQGWRAATDLDIIVENHAGGNSAIGYAYLLAKEGQPNFLLASETAGGIVLPIVQDVPYSWRSFTPIAQVVEDSTMIITPADSPFKSLKDLINAARNQSVTVGTTGRYGTDSIAFHLIANDQNVDFDRVVFNSGGEVNTALLGHDIDAASSNPSESIQKIKSGRFRPLAVVREKRFDSGILADVPTLAEQGVDIDVTPTLQYRGPFGSGGMTEEQTDYWIDRSVAWTKSDSYERYVNTNYLAPTVRLGQDFAAFLEHQEDALRSILKEMGVI